MNNLELRAALTEEYPEACVKYKNVLRSLISRMFVAADALNLKSETRYSSVVLFHRYACHYFSLESKRTKSSHDEMLSLTETKVYRAHMGVVAASCLFLGCKTEEEPRRIRDVINLSHKLGFSNIDPREESEDIVHIYEIEDPPKLDESYWKKKVEIIAMEQTVLRMLQFDVSVPRPHRAVLSILRILDASEKKQDLVLRAWRIMNDACFYTPALRLPLLPFVCGCLKISSQQSSVTLVCDEMSDLWPRKFGVNDTELRNAIGILKDATNDLVE